MTVQELVARFPEIPQDLQEEPLLAQYAVAFGDQLRVARNPGACSAQHDAANHYYPLLPQAGEPDSVIHVQVVHPGEGPEAASGVARSVPGGPGRVRGESGAQGRR